MGRVEGKVALVTGAGGGIGGAGAEGLGREGAAVVCTDIDAAAAEAAYRAALVLAPQWSVPHYNLGLVCKYAGRWEESFTFNQRATDLAADDQVGAI